MAKFSKIILFSALIFLLSTFLYPQPSDLIFQNLSYADGLPSNWISTIFQDHLGFLWFGTENGLVQYDGYHFKTYQPNENDPYSISNASIIQIDEDNNGNLWILTMDAGQINKFERNTGKFVHFLSNPEDSTQLEQNCVVQFYLDSFGDLWTIRFNRKLGKINTETGALPINVLIATTPQV
jgi:ligand-binding sensor domain-containing protein